MTKQEMIKKIKEINEKSIVLSKQHCKLLDKYSINELKTIMEGGLFAVKSAEATIELLQER